MTTRFLISAAMALTLAASSHAADTLKLKDGGRLTGEATAYDESQRILSFRTTDGELRRLHMDELDGRSVYHVVRSKVAKDDGPSQLKLANYARDIGLYAHSARHYRYAREASPELAPQIDVEMATMKGLAARWAMDRAEEAAKDGKIQEAEKWLTRLVDKLPDEPLADEARSLLSDYYDKVRAEKQAAIEAARPEQLAKELSQAKRNYDKMIELNKRALTSRRGTSQVTRDWTNAVKSGERALRDIDKTRKSTDDTVSLGKLSEYHDIVAAQIIEIHLHLASHYSTQSSYKKAAIEVNNALALDPTNRAALNMRARIEENASRSSRWWW